MKAKTTGLFLNTKQLCFIILSYHFSLHVFSQEETKSFESINVSDGLVQSLVIDILDDKYGDVWFGTYNGLSKYDGYEFVNFHHDPYDSSTLNNSTIWDLFETDNGDIWIGTDKGLNKYDRSKEVFVRYDNQFFTTINIINQWSKDTLILETSDGIWFFDIQDESFFQKEELNKYLHVSGIQFNHDGELILIDRQFMYLIGGNEIKKMEVGRAKALFVDSRNYTWIVTYSHIKRISPDFSDILVFPSSSASSFLAKIEEDKDGNILVANGKVYRFSPDGDLIEVHSNDPKRQLSLIANDAISITVDKSNNWWIGTSGYGVNRYDPNRFYINYLGHNPNSRPSLSNSYITSFYSKDDNNVYIGTAKSLDVYNVAASTVENIYPGRIDGFIAINNQLWAAAVDRLLVVDMNRNKVIREVCEGKFYGAIRSMQLDSNGMLWIASSVGLSKINPKNPIEFQNYLLEGHPKGSSDWFTSIYLEDDEMIIGTTSGFLKMDFEADSLRKLGDPILEPLHNSFIKCIKEDSHGIVWIGTDSDGLFRWDKRSKTLDHYSIRDGLPSNVVYGILEDDQGFLWMSTNYGLSRFDDYTSEFLNFDIEYGLQSNEFNTCAYFKSSGGILYFGGVEGFNYFEPTTVDNSIVPNTEITGFYIRNERKSPYSLGIKSGAIMDVDTIVLTHDQNMLSFDFTSTNHTLSKLNKYAYYMEGLEDDWNYVGSRRFANYSALQPGSYTFKVKSSNNSNIWDTKPAQIVITITEPYWQTSWFQRMVFTFMFIAVGVVVGLRIRSLNKSKERLNELVLERTKNLQLANEDLRKTMEENEKAKQQLIQSEKMAALGVLSAGVGHEINNPLNFIYQGLVGLEKEIGEEGKGDPQKINKLTSIMHEGVERASQIVKGLSNFSRSGTDFDENCNIESIIDNCIVLLNSKLKDRIEVKKEYSSENLEIPGNGGKLHQLFFNILFNAQQAIQNKGTIVISTVVEENEFIINIADTGIGINPQFLKNIFDPFFTTKNQGEGTGLGLSIAKSIAKEHNGDIRVSSTSSKGTSFRISLPTK